MIEGIDVSGWSGNLDIDRIVAECGFVYHQATDGVGTIDRMLMTRTKALRDAGMTQLGAYHFLRVRHGHAQDSDEQCKQFLDARANAGCDAIPSWLDCELGPPGSSNRAATHDEVRAAVELFLATWDQCLGGDLACYSSPGEMRAMGLLEVDTWTSRPLALAEYTSAPAPSLPAPYTTFQFHQHLGNVPRYGGVVDLVRWNRP